MAPIFWVVLMDEVALVLAHPHLLVFALPKVFWHQNFFLGNLRL